MKSISKRTLAIGVTVLLALAFGLYRMSTGPLVAVVQVQRKPLVQTIVASGRVLTPRRAEIASQITAEVMSVPFDEGEQVHKGDVLLELRADEVRAARDQAQAARQQARARLDQLASVTVATAEQGVRQALANRQLARAQVTRSRELYAKGFIGKAQLDDAERNLEVAESQVRAQQVQLAAGKPGGGDYATAAAALRQAEAAVAVAEAKLAQTRIVAPLDATVIGRKVEPGDTAQPGRVLLTLSPHGETEIELPIDEKNLALLALGQEALVSADAFPGKTFAAKLYYLDPVVDAQRGAVTAKLKVPAPPAYLRQDMTVSVDIRVAEKKDALVLPTIAVRELVTGQPWALVVRGGHAIRQNLQVGMRGESLVEISSGLAAGELVVPSAEVAIKPGQRVRVDQRGPPAAL